MYKDKDKQREADRERQRRHRAKSVTKGVADIRCDKQKRSKDIKSFVDLPPDEQRLVKQTFDVASPELNTMTDTERRYCRKGKGDWSPLKPKRGRDIKTFDDLPPDVQQTINTMSVVEGVID